MDPSLGAGERTFRVIDQITSALSSGEALEALQEAAARIADCFGFTRCALLAKSGDDPQLIYLVAASDDPSLERLPLDLRKYPELSAAMETREPVFILDAGTSVLLGKHAAHAAEHGGRSLLAVPLLIDKLVIGCLTLRSSPGRAPLDEADLARLRLVAQVVAVALGRGKVLESLRDQTRRIVLSSLDEQRRRRALEQYKEYFESTTDGMLVVDAGGVVSYMNRAAEQITGYARSGLCGRRLRDVVPEAQRDGLDEVVAQAAAGVHLAHFDVELVTTSGEPLRVSVSTSTVLAEHGSAVLAFRDVTEARALEDELRKTKDFLERLIDSAVDGIIAADMRGDVLVFNPGAERVFGYAAAEVVGKIRVKQLWPDGVAQEILAALRSPERGGQGRLEPERRSVLAKTGELVPVVVAASIIYEDGHEVATVGIFSDLRDRIRIEERLVEAEREALLAGLAGTTAHELNQPLTTVMGHAEMLLRLLPADDANRRSVENVFREAERMAEIVRKIGRITRYETKPYVGSATIIDLDKSAL